MKRKALTGLAAATAVVALAGSPAAGAGAPQATASAETLVSFVGAAKIKVGKRMTYSLSCLTNCNVAVSDLITGPRTKLKGSLSGAIAAGTTADVILKPNGPLLRDLKAFTGRFKLAATVTATDPATGETDTDKRIFRFK